MPRLALPMKVVALWLLLAAVAVRADDSGTGVCSDYTPEQVFEVADTGNITDSDGNVVEAAWDAAVQLANATAAEVHKNEDCTVTEWSVEKACYKEVEAGEKLDSGKKVKKAGTLYDVQLVETITCPDGGFKVRYQAHGVKSDSDTLDFTETRFMDVFDSTYV